MNRPILKKLPALLAILVVAGVVQAFTSCSSDDGGSPTGPQYNEKSSSSWAQTEVSSSSNQTFVEPSSSSAGGQNPNPVPSSSSVGQNIPSSSSVTPTTGLKQFGTAKAYVPWQSCLGDVTRDGCNFLGEFPAYSPNGSQILPAGETAVVGPLKNTGITTYDGLELLFPANAGVDRALCNGQMSLDYEMNALVKFDDPCIEQ
jgi:hypothetical protein